MAVFAQRFFFYFLYKNRCSQKQKKKSSCYIISSVSHSVLQRERQGRDAAGRVFFPRLLFLSTVRLFFFFLKSLFVRDVREMCPFDFNHTREKLPTYKRGGKFIFFFFGSLVRGKFLPTLQQQLCVTLHFSIFQPQTKHPAPYFFFSKKKYIFLKIILLQRHVPRFPPLKAKKKKIFWNQIFSSTRFLLLGVCARVKYSGLSRD